MAASEPIAATADSVALRPPRSGLTPSSAVLIGMTLLVAFLALYPVGWLVYGSFSSAPPRQGGFLTIQNYINAASNPLIRGTFWNTIIFSFGQMVVAVAIGAGLGWIIARTNTPGRRTFELLSLIVFLIPGLLAVLAWTMLLSPSKGIINQLLMWAFGLEKAPFNIYSMGGMIFLHGVYLAPFTYLMITPSFVSIDSGLEESARMSGSGVFKTFWRITLPLTRPAILSTALFMFIIGLESFDIPQMLGAPYGIYVFVTQIYTTCCVQYPPDYGQATALSSVLLAAAAVLIYFYRRSVRQISRFETIKGKGYRVGAADIGRWRWLTFAICVVYFFFTVVLPLAIVLLGSFLRFFGKFDMEIFNRMTYENYIRVLAHPALVNGFLNSLGLAVIAGAVCVLMAAVVGFITIRTRMTGRGLLDGVAMIPVAYPATVLGIGLVWAWVGVPVPIYGTILILAVAYITRYVPIGLRTVSGGIMQISDELESASKMSGASWLYGFRRIILPLMRPTLAAAWLIMFLLFMRELSMSIILAGTGNPVASVVIFDYYSSGELPPMAAASVIMAAAMIAVVWFARSVLKISYSDLRVG
ncbi:MAG: iron ABC transporter permease [Alphaproteobacteria bacterium]|nr:iron ABC transporter permease [Alphaproteobacteria bacterium]